MNLDFGADPLFSWYVVLLCLSGIAMFVLSAIGRSGQSTGVRVFTALVGVAFLGYGVYLGFIFQGGSYLLFFKAFILPALLLVNFIRALANRSTSDPARQLPNPQQSYGAQQPYAAQQGQGGQQSYGAQQDYNGQPTYGTQQGYSGQPSYGTQPSNGGQPAYGPQPGQATQPAYHPNPAYGAQQGHNGQPHNAPHQHNPAPTTPNHLR